MSNDVGQYLKSLEPTFLAQNNYDLVFNTECLFAKQQIMKNKYVLETAQNNQLSVRNAVLNVAAIGVSLNPALAHAYLVPRGGGICLDISYRGLVKLATDTGAIEWAKAILVYEGDEFFWHGPTLAPTHNADVFAADRIDATDPLKNLKGGYCLAKLTDGTYMVEVMTSGEILEVKHSSKAKDGPWNGRWAGEMAKKTLVKRASKSWPQSNGRDRIDKAISVLNEHEGLSIPESSTVSEYLKHSPEQHAEYHERLQGDALDFFLWWNPLDDRIKTSLINSFTEGKGKGRDLTNKLDATGREMFLDLLADLTRACEKEDGVGVAEVLESLTVPQREALLDRLNMELVLFARGVVDGLTEDDARQ